MIHRGERCGGQSQEVRWQQIIFGTPGRPDKRSTPAVSAATAPNFDTLPRQRDRRTHYTSRRPGSRNNHIDEQANLQVREEIRSSDSI
ncbi:hypothetical protein EYC84_004507 [Monilinia fructicola]|uniref:Uncharacterized protein n=1 Tax=Monilinia fructicola TaxID=38448 RepID=A0A5M9K8Y4_MONFR|nr:hypothetical protein EYC84_004507 [Monilinia fructicola]